MELTGFTKSASIAVGECTGSVVRMIDSRINQLFGYYGSKEEEFKYGGLVRKATSADIITVNCNFTSILYIDAGAKGTFIGQVIGLTNQSKVNMTDALIGVVIIFSQTGDKPVIEYPGVIGATIWSSGANIVQRVQSSVNIVNANDEGAGFIAKSFNSSWQIQEIVSFIVLVGNSKGTGFLGVIPQKGQSKLFYIPNYINFLGMLSIGYVQGLHGSAVLMGYSQGFFMHTFTGVAAVGFVIADKEDKEAKSSGDKLDSQPRCQGIVSGHVVQNALTTYTGIIIAFGKIEAKKCNVGLFGLVLGNDIPGIFLFAGILNIYVMVKSDASDSNGGHSLFTAYANGGVYTLALCLFSGKYESDKSNNGKW